MKNIFIALLLFLSVSCASKKEKVLYEELRPSEFRSRIKAAPIAYLPLGTLEYHGEHLPLGTDGIESQEFFLRLAHEVGGVVYPMLFLAPDTMRIVDGKEFYSLDQCFNKKFDCSAYWVPDSTFKIMMEGILHQMQLQGFKIVVAHGHGPSNILLLKYWKEWEEKFNLHIYSCVPWNARGFYDKEFNEKHKDDLSGIQADHAAASETSLMMLFRPELVNMSELPKDTAQKLIGIAGKDPRIFASAKLAQNAVDVQLERMAKLLRAELEQIK